MRASLSRSKYNQTLRADRQTTDKIGSKNTCVRDGAKWSLFSTTHQYFILRERFFEAPVPLKSIMTNLSIVNEFSDNNDHKHIQ